MPNELKEVNVVSERVVLKDMMCPLIRLDQSRRKDKSVSFSISVVLHVVIFLLVGLSLIKPPQFGVDQGLGGIEVNLVAAPSEVVPKMVVETPVEAPSEFIEKVIEKPLPPVEEKPIIKTEGKNKNTVQTTAGAISEAKPDYLNNPAPAYPAEARRKGWEGTVVLKALVDKNGFPQEVKIEKSSGHYSLDKVALEAVKKWKFHPAKLGSMPVESSVVVPVRFDLDTSK